MFLKKSENSSTLLLKNTQSQMGCRFYLAKIDSKKGYRTIASNNITKDYVH